MLERLGLLPEQVIMVGDSYRHDVKGPEDNNMNSILLDRTATSNGIHLRKLTELFYYFC